MSNRRAAMETQRAAAGFLVAFVAFANSACLAFAGRVALFPLAEYLRSLRSRGALSLGVPGGASRFSTKFLPWRYRWSAQEFWPPRAPIDLTSTKLRDRPARPPCWTWDLLPCCSRSRLTAVDTWNAADRIRVSVDGARVVQIL